MREILFRAKRVDGGEWLYGHYVRQYGADMIYLPDGVDREYGFDYYHIDKETVGQFTGLTDRNGKRIFEGDIVKVERDLWHGENKKEREIFNGVVWYDETWTCFGLKCEKYKCLPLHRFKGDHQTVIGNIHDNPELLN